jgi:hypothetical protein
MLLRPTPAPDLEQECFDHVITQEVLMLSKLLGSQGVDLGVTSESRFYSVSIYKSLTPITRTSSQGVRRVCDAVKQSPSFFF